MNEEFFTVVSYYPEYDVWDARTLRTKDDALAWASKQSGYGATKHLLTHEWWDAESTHHKTESTI